MSCLVLNAETQFESHLLSNLSRDSVLDFQGKSSLYSINAHFQEKMYMQEISYVRTKSGKSPRIKFKDIKAREQNNLRFFLKRATKTIKIMDNTWLPESFEENKTHKHTHRIFSISNGLPRQELFTI